MRAPHDRGRLAKGGADPLGRYQYGATASAPSKISASRRRVAGVVLVGQAVEREEAGLGDLAVRRLRRRLRGNRSTR